MFNEALNILKQLREITDHYTNWRGLLFQSENKDKFRDSRAVSIGNTKNGLIV